MAVRTDAQIAELSFGLFRDAVSSAHLQLLRLQATEDKFDDVIMRRTVWDWQFLITSLWRMRRMATLFYRIESVREPAKQAVQQFDSLLPQLKNMRDVWEHSDAYIFADESRHNKNIITKGLRVGRLSYDPRAYHWGIDDRAMELAQAQKAYLSLFDSIKELKDSVCSPDRFNRSK